MITCSTHDTPAGPFSILVGNDGEVLASGWTSPAALLTLAGMAPGTRLQRRKGSGAASTAITAYLSGDLGAIDTVVVSQSSGPFIERSWRELRDIRAGQSVTYSELAARAGRPMAVRAAAQACARNAAALFVPCHRVVRTNGGLGGFRYGLPVKQWLLEHETLLL